MGLDEAGRPSTVKTLPAVPGLGGLYARAVLPGWPRLPGRNVGENPDDPALPDVTYRVADVVADPEHLLSYQRLLGEPADDALPAGYVHVLAFPVAMALMVRPDFPLPVAGMVHLANTVTVARTIRAEERLEVHAWAQDLRPHAKGTQVDLVTEVCARYGAGDDQRVVWRGVSTYLAKGVARSTVDGGIAASSANGAGRAAGTTEETSGFTPPMPTARWALDAGTGRRYAAVSGDRNPIHLSALTAKAFGFPRAIAHGMYTAARALAESGAGRQGAFEWTVEFAKPVLLPSTVALAITEDETDGFTYSGWNPRSGKEHFRGTVTPR